MTQQVLDVKNYWKEEDRLYLSEDEEVCPDCKGHGIVCAFNIDKVLFNKELRSIIDNDIDLKDKTIGIVYCNRCCGEGKIDWIRKIRGTQF